MSQMPGSIDADLTKAAELLQAGNKKDARLLLRDVLARDANNVNAWELLFRASYNSQEETFCLKKILQLRPNHPWAAQRLAALTSAASFESPAFYSSSPKPVARAPKQKKRRRMPIPLILSGAGIVGLLCLGLLGFAMFQAGFLPFSSANLTATALALNAASCQAVIQKAMQASSQYCDQIGPNKACYGNKTIKADLATGATQRFSQRGDVVDVNQLQRLSAAPLNVNNDQWGIAIFNIMANLPRSLPGETVKLVVFGNTTINKNTPNLESFYFSNELGQIACEQVPSDGIMITMPNGTGVSFTINGTQMTLMGDASLTATKNGSMAVNLYSGSGSVEAGGQKQYLGGGETVQVPLGGPDGVSADGPPSQPVPLPDGGKKIYCDINPDKCPNGDVPTPATVDVQKTIEAGLGTPTPAKTSTRSATPGPSQTPLISPTPLFTLTRYVLASSTLSPAPSAISGTKTKTPTRTLSPAPTRTGTVTPPTITRTTAPTRTPTRTRTPTVTRTVTLTRTPSFTPTPTSTSTRTLTATQTSTRTPTFTVTLTRTASATFTQTDTPTLTPIPTITDTPTNTAIPTSTPGACSSSNLAVSALTASGTQLQVSLTNNFGSAIAIQELDFTWDSSTGVHLKTIQLDATTIWTGNVLTPQTITSFSGSTSIASGSTATLILDFTPKTAMTTGNSLTLFFDQGCQVSVSN